MCEVAIVLQVNSSNCIGSFATGPKPKSYNRPICPYCVPWILVVSNDLGAGTALD